MGFRNWEKVPRTISDRSAPSPPPSLRPESSLFCGRALFSFFCAKAAIAVKLVSIFKLWLSYVLVEEGAAAGWSEENIFPRSVHAATVDIGWEGLFRRGAASFQNQLPIPNEQLAPPKIDLFSFGFFTAIKKYSPQLLLLLILLVCQNPDLGSTILAPDSTFVPLPCSSRHAVLNCDLGSYMLYCIFEIGETMLRLRLEGGSSDCK